MNTELNIIFSQLYSHYSMYTDNYINRILSNLNLSLKIIFNTLRYIKNKLCVVFIFLNKLFMFYKMKLQYYRFNLFN
jgi:hypothetical protein